MIVEIKEITVVGQDVYTRSSYPSTGFYFEQTTRSLLLVSNAMVYFITDLTTFYDSCIYEAHKPKNKDQNESLFLKTIKILTDKDVNINEL